MKTKYTKVATLAFALITFESLTGEANAATHLVDFSQFAVPGGNWNSLTSTQNTNFPLIDSTGSNLGVTLTHNLSSDSNITGGWTAGDVDWVATAAASDGFYSGTSAMITFAGLGIGNYSIRLVSAEDGDSGGGAFTSTSDIQVAGVFADSNRLGTSANGDDWNTKTDGVNNWLQWDGVASSGGEISISIDASSSGFTTINAIEITRTSVPEPTSSLLLCLGGLGFISLRRRRS
ncbi:PEP-CTERM sorting domain-containing protein [Roseibacillus persicicus]|uniref:PEP-CTERM sorting domain-containing protein n=1 Tax=Roseibacillus persicicus TaxID=454148 RepID=UPI00280CBAC5|nr:PEP-CTERM sorting domain-containing protein [Roseibacillus persicicus]MDQ8192643.1 PEP-CTERM sorting domain-containing protein [Roseibacillus persicicus]